MEMQAQVVIGVICTLLALYSWTKNKSSKLKLLPGPMPLPLIGNMLQIGRKPHASFLKMMDIYGPIFKVKIGSLNAIVLNDHKMIKELFNDNVSTGRMGDNPATYEFSRGPYGVVNSEGTTWEEQRRFTIRTLRNLGFAKTSMETMILDEVHSMLNWFDRSNSKPINGCRIFHAPVVNSLWRIVSGERCDWEQGKPLILQYNEAWQNSSARIATSGVFFAPVLRHIAPGYLGWTKYVQSCCNMHKLFAKSIATHRITLDPNNLRDFIDWHLKETLNTKDEQSSFYGDVAEKNLSAAMVDLFVAGSETTSNTLSWTLLYLTYHPKIQNRLHHEIDQVIGSLGVPSLANRTFMPYTEAVIAEVLRMSSTVCIGLAHCMLESKEFYGYYLPKGMAVFSNVYGVHHRKDVWGDPQNFRPERFLGENGKFVKNDALIAFGEGKRRCIGEAMARDSLFLFVTSVFQRFKVLPGNVCDLPDFEAELGYLLEPKEFKVRMVPRARKYEVDYN